MTALHSGVWHEPNSRRFRSVCGRVYVWPRGQYDLKCAEEILEGREVPGARA